MSRVDKERRTNTMDTMMIKERNYRMVEMLRHQNEREQRRLESSLYSKQGLEANHRYTVENMNREQQMLREELARLKQTSSTTWGVLPPRNGSLPTSKPEVALYESSKTKSKHHNEHTGNKRRSHREGRRRKPSVEEQKEVEHKKAEEVITKFNEDFPPDGVSPSKIPQLPPLPTPVVSVDEATETPVSLAQSDTTTTSKESIKVQNKSELPLSDINVEETKGNIAKRLNTNTENTNSEKSGQADNTGSSNDSESKSPQRPYAGTLSPVREIKEEPKEDLQLTTETLPKIAPPATSEAVEKKTQNQKLKKRKPKLDAKQQAAANESKFDANKYNPDGSVRTMHNLPDFQTSLREAMKARYLRMKGPQWVQRELSISEIFKLKSRAGRVENDK